MNAMAARRVLVSTRNGVQGMPGTVGRDFLVGATMSELAGVLVWALREPRLADRIAANGYALARQSFSKAAFLDASVQLFRRSLCPHL
jgi:glycosyltransferase involved in cell wall biosynthesis